MTKFLKSSNILRREKFMFLLVGLVGYSLHNAIAVALISIKVEIFLANCIGFIFANQMTYLGHAKFTFKVKKNYRLRMSYFFVSVFLLITSNLFLSLILFLSQISPWTGLLIANLFNAIAH